MGGGRTSPNFPGWSHCRRNWFQYPGWKGNLPDTLLVQIGRIITGKAGYPLPVTSADRGKRVMFVWCLRCCAGQLVLSHPWWFYCLVLLTRTSWWNILVYCMDTLPTSLRSCLSSHAPALVGAPESGCSSSCFCGSRPEKNHERGKESGVKMTPWVEGETEQLQETKQGFRQTE